VTTEAENGNEVFTRQGASEAGRGREGLSHGAVLAFGHCYYYYYFFWQYRV
jgi:hypothetical protein